MAITRNYGGELISNLCFIKTKKDMTAAEANNKTKAKIMEFIPLQYDRVMADIERRISGGYFTYCYVYFGADVDLYPENRQRLIDDGFKLRCGDGAIDGYASYIISWGNDKEDKKSFFSFFKRLITVIFYGFLSLSLFYE
jgi:hypothetical protein